MSTILTRNTQVITIRQAFWTDEHSWTPVAQRVSRTLDGSTIIEVLPGSAGGQPMTLLAEWVQKYQLDILAAWRDSQTQVPLSVQLEDTRTFSCVFRHHDGVPLEVEPIKEYMEYEDDDYFNVLIKLMIVEE